MGIGYLLAIFPLEHCRYGPIPQNAPDNLVTNFPCVLCIFRRFYSILTKTFPGMPNQIACRRVVVHKATDHTTATLSEATEDVTTPIVLVLDVWSWLEKAIDGCMPFFLLSRCH